MDFNAVKAMAKKAAATVVQGAKIRKMISFPVEVWEEIVRLAGEKMARDRVEVSAADTVVAACQFYAETRKRGG